MTINNKPQDNDSLIERRRGSLGDEKLVATRAFLRFLDDLVAEINTSINPDVSDIRSLVEDETQSLEARLVGLRSALEDWVNELAEPSPLEATIITQRAEIANLSALVEDLAAENAKLQSLAGDLDQRIKNLEAETWQ